MCVNSYVAHSNAKKKKTHQTPPGPLADFGATAMERRDLFGGNFVVKNPCFFLDGACFVSLNRPLFLRGVRNGVG